MIFSMKGSGFPPNFFSAGGLLLCCSVFGSAASLVGESIRPNSGDDVEWQLIFRSLSTWLFIAAIGTFLFHPGIFQPQTILSKAIAYTALGGMVFRIIAAGVVAYEEICMWFRVKEISRKPS